MPPSADRRFVNPTNSQSTNVTESANHSNTLPMQMASRTDVGLRRQRNEDFLGTERTPHGLLAVVCDGMGGHAGGDRASRLAVETFIRSVGAATGQPETILRDAAAEANRAVYEESQRSPERSGMGTTLVAALVDNDVATVVNIGDSRAYHLGDRGLARLTEDHSLVGEMVAQGTLSEEQARVHPQRNVITRALGLRETVRADVSHVQLHDGDSLLLCTDGLHGMIDDRSIEQRLRTQPVAQSACDSLIESALDAGGDDNVTVILLRFGQLAEAAHAAIDSATVDPQPRTASGWVGRWALLPILGLALLAAWYVLLRQPAPEPAPAALDSAAFDSTFFVDSSVSILNDSSQQTPFEQLSGADSDARRPLAPAVGDTSRRDTGRPR